MFELLIRTELVVKSLGNYVFFLLLLTYHIIHILFDELIYFLPNHFL